MRPDYSKIPIPISRPFSFTIAAEEIVIGSTFATKFPKFRTTAGNTFKSPLDIEIKNSGSASSSLGREVPSKQVCWARALWVASCCFKQLLKPGLRFGDLSPSDAIGYALTREHYLALKVRGKILTCVKPSPDLQKESSPEGPAYCFRMYSRPVQISRAHHGPFLHNRNQTPHRHLRPRHVS